MLATTHIILLFFGIFQMCSTKMPDCMQLMLPNQLCATLTCFPVPWCSFLNALNCPVPFFSLIISKLMDWSGAVSAYPHESAILPTYSCVCHRWRSYCSYLFWDCFQIGKVAFWIRFHICTLICELLLLVFWALRVLTRNTQTDSAKALPECKQNVTGTVVAPEVV